MKAKPQMFVMNRNFTVRTTKGHTIAFEKGVPIMVPPRVVADCMQCGAVPVEELPEVPEEKKNEAPEGLDRMEKIKAACAEIAERNVRDDFTTGGRPKVQPVEMLLDFDVDMQEVIDAWAQYKADVKAAQENGDN